MTDSLQPYRVLARKYRPQTFDALVGQEAMVRTLANAIRRDRLAHAFLLTGVRGVGKTSTARLIAKALNCVGPEGTSGPTIDPCGVCEPCRAIADGRHIDVVEMDAASNTGVDDVREIIEAVRYAAVSARFKIYIIDEVHMLTKNAFNALLKTLEEPPAHVKFLFATTEVNKVPVTVLSRCQRFDLRRIPAEKLAEHFSQVAAAEGVEVEEEAVRLIARAAEGSARDGLSILDQAIAHGGGRVEADQVRAMLGLSDRGAVRRLLGLLLAGDASGALQALRAQYDLGVEPAALIRGLLEATHGITRSKVGGDQDPAWSVEEREAYAEWSTRLSHGALHRLWQLLLKGLSDLAVAPSPLEAAEMALLRVMYAVELPDPGAIVGHPGGQAGQPSETAGTTAPSRPVGSGGQATRAPSSFRELVERLAAEGKAHLSQQLHDHVRIVRYAPFDIAYVLARPIPGEFGRELGAALKSVFGGNWNLEQLEQHDEAQPSLLEQEKADAEALRKTVLDSPIVRAAFESFPEAELASYTIDDQRSA